MATKLVTPSVGLNTPEYDSPVNVDVKKDEKFEPFYDGEDGNDSADGLGQSSEGGTGEKYKSKRTRLFGKRDKKGNKGVVDRDYDRRSNYERPDKEEIDLSKAENPYVGYEQVKENITLEDSTLLEPEVSENNKELLYDVKHRLKNNLPLNYDP